MESPFWESRAIYVVRSGSHAYGMNLPTSDEDTKGVCIPPAEYILGLQKWEHTTQADYPDRDRQIYSLHRFVELALQCKPTVIEVLFVRESDILHTTESGRQLREYGPRFLSKRAFQTFGNYAVQQLKLLQRGKTARHGTHAHLVERFGYDVKNAVHLVRILRMGCEILATGLVHTYRPDAEELLSIRQGAWTLDQVLAEAAGLEEKLQWANSVSALPDEPDFDAANRMVMFLTRRALEGRL